MYSLIFLLQTAAFYGITCCHARFTVSVFMASYATTGSIDLDYNKNETQYPGSDSGYHSTCLYKRKRYKLLTELLRTTNSI